MNQETWEDTLAAYLPEMKKRSPVLYWLMIGCVGVLFGSLFLIRVPVYVSSSGMIRPSPERVFIRVASGGIVDSLYSREGAAVRCQDMLVRLRDPGSGMRLQVLQEEISKYRLFIHDLEALRLSGEENLPPATTLVTPYFRRQASRFSFHLQEIKTSVDKAEEDMALNRSLAAERVISPREWYDIQSQRNRIRNGFSASWQEQQADWEQELVRYRSALNECLARKNELIVEAAANEVRAPVAGIVQGIGSIYPGSRVQANDIVCTVSPEGSLRMECLVSSGDIARIRLAQPVVCRIDAFDYRFFGLAGGRVLAIDNDFTVVDKQAVFRVICSVDQRLPLKKGMTCRARFIIARRTLWQLLFDRLDDWFV